MGCGSCKDKKNLVDAVMTQQNLLIKKDDIETKNRIIAIAHLKEALRHTRIAYDLEVCDKCKAHINEAIESLTENITMGELGVLWDITDIPAWIIARDVTMSIINQLRAGFKRIRKSRKGRKKHE